LIEGLARRIPGEFLVVVPDGIRPSLELSRDHFLSTGAFRAPSHPLLNHIVAANKLLALVRKKFPNAILHSPGPIWGLARPATTIVTLHDCIYRSFPRYLGRFFVRRWYLRATERFAARASLVLTDSEFSKADLVNRLGIAANRIEVLYPWVGPEYSTKSDTVTRENLRARLRLPGRFWLYLGGYDYRKNVEVLIEAYAAARRKRTLPPLVLAGHIPQKSTRVTCDVFGAVRKTGLGSDEILMPGRISAGDLPDLYRASALLIYPSLMEGFGLPPAEAMAVGTPVLVSNSSSLPEVVQNSECFFDVNNAVSLMEKLLAAAEDERQFSAALSPMFTQAHGIERYLQLIKKVAATE
jgi:glycosyltransferase involved in cell wall biosynthesis